MGMPQAMLMVRDSILADERSSGAEDGLLRKTQTEEKKRRYLGLFFRLGGRGAKTGCMLELESKLGRKLKQGSRLSDLATTFFPVYFIFFISLMFHSL